MSVRWEMVSHGSTLCKNALEKFASEMKGSLINELQQEYLSAYMWDGLRMRAAEQYDWDGEAPVSLRSRGRGNSGDKLSGNGARVQQAPGDSGGPWIHAISKRRRKSKASLMALALGNVRFSRSS